MQRISLPQKPKYTSLGDNYGKFEIQGCYPGYGTTLGNAMRRVLLSSLEGAAIESVKIDGVAHEFSTIDGVMEDAVQIILNLKKVRFKLHGDESVKVSLKVKGEGQVTAKDFKTVSGIEVVNPDQVIATISDKKTELHIEVQVGKGLGYVPVEQQIRDQKEIGVIAVDAIYTPIKRVNYEVENMRVGKRTDFDRITLEIVTDGSISPEEAFATANKILVDQFTSLVGGIESNEEGEDSVIEADVVEESVVSLKEAGLTAKAIKLLAANGIETLAGLSEKTEDEISAIEGATEKMLKDIRKALESVGMKLK